MGLQLRCKNLNFTTFPAQPVTGSFGKYKSDRVARRPKALQWLLLHLKEKPAFSTVQLSPLPPDSQGPLSPHPALRPHGSLPSVPQMFFPPVLPSVSGPSCLPFPPPDVAEPQVLSGCLRLLTHLFSPQSAAYGLKGALPACPSSSSSRAQRLRHSTGLACLPLVSLSAPASALERKRREVGTQAASLVILAQLLERRLDHLLGFINKLKEKEMVTRSLHIF